MDFIKAHDYEEMSRLAARMLADQLAAKPESVIALPTGSTPIGTYAQLARLHKDQGLDFSKAFFFNVDEYVGMGPDAEQGYAHFLWKHFYQNVNVNKSHVFAPDGLAADPGEAAADYEEEINRAGGLDIAFLGIGRNGHVGFNEPSRELPFAAHCVTLTQSTREANARFFSAYDEVPEKAITIGMGTIMHASRILLIANGPDKQSSVERLQNTQNVTTEFPASLLRLHRDAVMISAV